MLTTPDDGNGSCPTCGQPTSLSASPTPPQTADDGATLDKANNAALLELSKVWQLDGDWMKCRACDRPLIASRDGEPLSHRAGCKNSAHVHPWAELRSALASSPTPAATEEGLVQANAEPVASDGSVTGPVCQWQPIETAPKDGTYIDIWGVNPAGQRFPDVRWTDFPPVGAVEGFTWRNWQGVPVVDHADAVATRWMPRPAPPGDRTTAPEAQSGSLNQALPAATDAVAVEREALEQARRDIQCLLSIIEYVEEATGGGPEDEDAALVAQIRTSYECGLDSPEAIRARGTDGGTNG